MDTLKRRRIDVSHYTYRVAWSAEDDEFVATVVEFPSLSWLAPAQMEALQGLETLLAKVIADMQQQGEEVPADLRTHYPASSTSAWARNCTETSRYAPPRRT